MLVYLRDGSAQITVRVATLKQKLQIKLAIYEHRPNLSEHGTFNARRLAG